MLGVGLGLTTLRGRAASGVEATGGTVTEITVDGVAYKVHTFTASDDFVVTRGGTVEYLIVGGGGSSNGKNAAGNQGGGGAGGGGVLTGSTTITAQSFAVVVGQGGVTSTAGFAPSQNGENSSAFGLVAVGGAGGSGEGSTTPKSGGSGAGGYRSNAPGSGTAGQGNDGGVASGFTGGAHGGGGGAGGPALQIDTSVARKQGGIGLLSSITGSPTRYGAGGGGSRSNAGGDENVGGLGGDGGGGDGTGASGFVSTNGTDGTGGGAGAVWGGSNSDLGTGGDGIVIIRYPA